MNPLEKVHFMLLHLMSEILTRLLSTMNLFHDDDACNDGFAAIGSIGYNVIYAAGNTLAVVGYTVPDTGAACRCAVPYKLSACGDNLHLGIVHQSSDGNGAVVVGRNGVGEDDDIALAQFLLGSGCLAHEAAESLVRSEDDFSCTRMDGDALYVVAQQRAVLCGEVVQCFLSVGTDEEGSVVLGAYPFTIGGVDGDAANVDVAEKIVCQSAAVVAVYLNLRELEVGVKDLGDIFNDEESGGGAYPHHTVQVLAEAVELFGRIGGAVLVCDVLEQDGLVVLVALGSLCVDAEDAFHIDASAGDEFESAAVMQDFVYQGNTVYFLIVEVDPFPVRFEVVQHRISHAGSHPQVPIGIVAQGRTCDVVVVARTEGHEAVQR